MRGAVKYFLANALLVCSAPPLLQAALAPAPMLDAAALAELQDQLQQGEFKPFLLPGLQENDLPQPGDVIDLSNVPGSQQPNRFYAKYLSTYYPRACVIGTRYFCSKKPEEVEVALQDVVKLFKDEPWFYFVDRPDNFNHAAYWEYIVDQLSIMHEFLVRLRVDPQSRVIFHPRQGSTSGAGRKAKYLIDFLLEDCNSVAVPQSIALSYDYVNKLFIDAIKREDIPAAAKYRAELEYLEENLRHTVYERDYHEHFAGVVGSLFTLLKKSKNLSDEKIEQLVAQQRYGKFSGLAGGGYGES